MSEAVHGATDEEAVQSYGVFLDDSLELAQEVVEELRALDPPAKAQAAHDRWISAIERLTTTFEGVADQAKGAMTLDEATALVVDGITQDAATAAEACEQVEQIGLANGVEIDLMCGE